MKNDQDRFLEMYQNLTPTGKYKVQWAIVALLVRSGDLKTAAFMFRGLLWRLVRVVLLGCVGAILASAGLATVTPAFVLAGVALLAAAWILARQEVEDHA